MEYRLVIFDFDGTLADSLPWLMGVINQVADKYKFKRISYEEQQSLRGCTPGEVIRHLGVPKWKIPLIASHVRKLAAANIGQIPLFEGTSEVLQQLSAAGALLGVVTSNAEANVRSVLGPEIAALIQYYECGVSVFGKSANLKKLLKKSGIPPGQAILIGDEIRDIEAARKVGMAAAAVSWGYNNIEALKSQNPDEAFTRVEEITAKLT